MIARNPAKLEVQLVMELCHQRGAEFLAKSVALGRASAIDIALNREQRVEFLHGLECDRIDHADLLAAAFLARCAFNVGKLGELPPRMGKAARLEDRTGLAVRSIELVVASIGVGLQNAGPFRQVTLGMIAQPVARVMEDHRWRIVVTLKHRSAHLGKAMSRRVPLAG